MVRGSTPPFVMTGLAVFSLSVAAGFALSSIMVPTPPARSTLAVPAERVMLEGRVVDAFRGSHLSLATAEGRVTVDAGALTPALLRWPLGVGDQLVVAGRRGPSRAHPSVVIAHGMRAQGSGQVYGVLPAASVVLATR